MKATITKTSAARVVKNFKAKNYVLAKTKDLILHFYYYVPELHVFGEYIDVQW